MSQILNLVRLYVWQNKLSGPLDELFSNSVSRKIATLNLSNNLFDGGCQGLWVTFHNIIQLEYLDVSSNMLWTYSREKGVACPICCSRVWLIIDWKVHCREMILSKTARKQTSLWENYWFRLLVN